MDENIHWYKFCALLKSINGGCKLYDIIDIRGRKIPTGNRFNKEEVQNLLELKEIYKLDKEEDEEEVKSRVIKKMNNLFSRYKEVK